MWYFSEVFYWETALISSNTTTSKAKKIKKPTHEKMYVEKETRCRDKFGIIDQPGDCPGTRWSMEWNHLGGKRQTASLIPICRASKVNSHFAGQWRAQVIYLSQSLWSQWNFFNEFENNPSKKPPIETHREASCLWSLQMKFILD